ncbi:MAG: hypothetical protein MUF05_00175 [Candidatus Omnitrophica bacterium]|jgi:hypothetical protein|nr:hypothetical protein [Candidatus Omnitrophota bacterium]
MEKIRYELDPYNRITVKNSALRGSRKVLDGQFKISSQNILSYHVKYPVPKGVKSPHQLKLKGIWSLTEDHKLRLTLDQSKRETFGQQLTLQGEILDVKSNSLLFAVTTHTKNGMTSLYTLELSGCWQVDKRNRLTFEVDKGQGESDILVFQGAWEINEKYQIIYSYQRKNLVRRNKDIHTLIFKGYWDIKDKARLSYVLDADSGSAFDFRISAGLFKDGFIKYELGIVLSRKNNPLKRVVTLFGQWKIKEDIGLVFEVRCGERKIQEIVFGAEAKLRDKGTVSFKLRNSLNKKICAELELSRDIFKGNGQIYLRLLAEKKEKAVLIGAGWRW